ncbi:MAG: WbqC family protein [Bacteroidales bacterium]|nr:WbqC family protein [Bacteroidales bacterium]
MSQSNFILLEAFESFPRQTYRNRFEIAGPNGIQKLVVPVQKYANHTLTKDIRISYDENWQRNHWRSIVTAYNSSPFFLYYQDEIEVLFFKHHEFLIDFNLSFIQYIHQQLALSSEYQLTTDFQKNTLSFADFRNDFHHRNQAQDVFFSSYYQVFDAKLGFIPNLSALDILFNLGPEMARFLK